MSPDFCYDLLTAGRGCFADVGRGSVKTAFCDMIVMAVAGITAHRRTDLVFVNGTSNAQKYRQDILARHVVHSSEPIVVLFNRMTPFHTLHGTIWTI